MFISNNRASFHLWWKQNLIKHQKESQDIMKLIVALHLNEIVIKSQIYFELYNMTIFIALKANFKLTKFFGINLFYKNIRFLLFSYKIFDYALLCVPFFILEKTKMQLIIWVEIIEVANWGYFVLILKLPHITLIVLHWIQKQKFCRNFEIEL